MSSIHHLIKIDKPSSVVFDALTNNDTIAQWFTETQCSEWRAGAKVIWFDSTEMTISQIISNKSITMQVNHGSGWENTTLHFEVDSIGDRTTVRFDQTGWPEVTDHFRDCSMSWAYFLESLKLYLETGTGTPEGVAPACGETA